MFNKQIKNIQPYAYFIFRIIVGFLFFQHGAMKLLGWFGATKTMELFSLMGFVGVLELVGGLAILLGFFTRLAAFGDAILMLIVYFKVHFPNGWIPIQNGGELALLFFAAFLIIIVYGAGKWSLEKLILRKEIF